MLDELVPLKTLRAIAYALGALAVMSAGYFVYDAIYDRGYQAAVIVKDAEAKANEEANNKAIAASEKTLREDMAVLILEKEKLEDDLARLNAEAAADPDAATGGLKRSGVQRINAVR